MATVLLGTAVAVLPPADADTVLAVCMQPADSAAMFAPKLQAAIASAEHGGGVLVMTDMFGGTPTNLSMTMLQSNQVEVVTGVNLPMLVKAMQLQASGSSVALAAREVRDAGHRSIAVASALLQRPGGGAS